MMPQHNTMMYNTKKIFTEVSQSSSVYGGWILTEVVPARWINEAAGALAGIDARGRALDKALHIEWMLEGSNLLVAIIGQSYHKKI